VPTAPVSKGLIGRMVAASDGPRKPIPGTTWVNATTAGEIRLTSCAAGFVDLCCSCQLELTHEVLADLSPPLAARAACSQEDCRSHPIADTSLQQRRPCGTAVCNFHRMFCCFVAPSLSFDTAPSQHSLLVHLSANFVLHANVQRQPSWRCWKGATRWLLRISPTTHQLELHPMQ
jgi:hypothetical protein